MLGIVKLNLIFYRAGPNGGAVSGITEEKLRLTNADISCIIGVYFKGCEEKEYAHLPIYREPPFGARRYEECAEVVSEPCG